MDENSLKVLLRTRILEAVRSVKPPGKWKIVVVDKHSLKLISSVLKLYDLLEEDVSIVETITKSRQPFTDREAVYFLSPTKESVSRFIDDFTKKGPGWNKGAMYAGAHLFFTTELDDVLFSRLTVSKSAKYIKSIKELYIEVNAYEPKVYLTKPSSYPFYNMYSPHAGEMREMDIEANVDRLISLVATLNVNPYVRFYDPKRTYENRLKTKDNVVINISPEDGSDDENEYDDDFEITFDEDDFNTVRVVDGVRKFFPKTPKVAEKTARLFYKRLQKYSELNPDFPRREDGQYNDVILFLDRSVDMYAPLLHEFTYQAMINDFLDLEDGKKYKFEVNSGGTIKQHEVVLNEEKDKLWQKLRHVHIADAIEELAKKFQQLVGDNKLIVDLNKNDSKSTLKQMKTILETMPEFQELQDTYSTHINLTRECMTIFDHYYLSDLAGLEQDISTKITFEGKPIGNDIEEELVEVLANQNMEETDRIRLLMIYLISKDGIDPLDRRRLQEVLECMTTEDKRGLLNLNLMGVRTDKEKEEEPRKKYEWEKALPITSIKYDLSRFVPAVKSIIEEQSRNILDPAFFPWVGEAPEIYDSRNQIKLKGSLRTTKNDWSDSTKVGKRARGRIIVFMTGGITYSEMLHAYGLSQDLLKDVYIGSTHITTPREFLEDLKMLRRVVDQQSSAVDELLTTSAVGGAVEAIGAISARARGIDENSVYTAETDGEREEKGVMPMGRNAKGGNIRVA